MRIRLLLLTAFAAWVAGAAHAWPTIPPRGDTARPAPTLDQLIDRLAEVKAKETELRSQRADLERQVRERLGEQARRLQAVGAPPAGGIALPLFPTVTLPDADLGLMDSKVGRGTPGTATPHAVPPPDPVTGGPAVPSTQPLPTSTLPAPGSPVHEPASTVGNRNQQAEWPPTAWEDRLDGLGGLPLAYTRQGRDTDRRRATESAAAPVSAAGNRNQQAEWPPTAWEDRLDGLGGFPLAYRRWQRDTTPEGLFYPCVMLFGGD